MNRIQCWLVVCCECFVLLAWSPAAPVKVVLQLSHCRRARNVCAVYEQRSVKVTRLEHLDYVSKVTTDLVAALGTPKVVGPDIDQTTIVMKFKMVRRLMVRKPHCLVAMLVDQGLVVLLREVQ
jgi:hypothetical protein